MLTPAPIPCFGPTSLATARRRLPLAALLFTLVPALSGCADQRPQDAWAADLTRTNQVLFIYFSRSGADIEGTGRLQTLTEPGPGESLSIVGSRTADTLDLNLRRPDGSNYHLVAWYLRGGDALTGVLNGGTFVMTNVSFRRN